VLSGTARESEYEEFVASGRGEGDSVCHGVWNQWRGKSNASKLWFVLLFRLRKKERQKVPQAAKSGGSSLEKVKRGIEEEGEMNNANLGRISLPTS